MHKRRVAYPKMAQYMPKLYKETLSKSIPMYGSLTLQIALNAAYGCKLPQITGERVIKAFNLFRKEHSDMWHDKNLLGSFYRRLGWVIYTENKTRN